MQDIPKPRIEVVRDALASSAGVGGLTCKVDIGNHDLYVKLAFMDSRLVKIDATVSAGKSINGEEAHPAESSRYDIVRMWIESECQIASDLIASGVADPDYLISWWVGRRGYPSGYSQKLAFEENGVMRPMIIKGPFDAIAKLLRARLTEWTYAQLTNP